MHCNNIPVYWHCPLSVRSRVYLTVGCPSVCLSVRPSVPSFDRSSYVRQVCCWAPCGQEISPHSGGRPAATALSSKRRQCHVDSRVDEAQHDTLVDLVNLWSCAHLFSLTVIANVSSIISLFCITYHTTCYLQQFAVESGLTVYTVKPNFERRTTTMLFVIEHHVPCVRLPNICHVCAKNRHFDFFANCQWHISTVKMQTRPFLKSNFVVFDCFCAMKVNFAPFDGIWSLLLSPQNSMYALLN